MNAADILTPSEIARTLTDLRKRWEQGPNAKVNLTVFRLSACCGLRCCEMSGINLGDVTINGERPEIRIRKAVTKGQKDKRRARRVPLWWDRGTRDDLAAWMEHLRANGKTDPDLPFLCSVSKGRSGNRMKEYSIARRWRTAISILGPDRVEQIHAHCGRHTFISHALHGGRSLAEVRDAAGHASVNTTSIYLHVVAREGVADLFNYGQ